MIRHITYLSKTWLLLIFISLLFSCTKEIPSARRNAGPAVLLPSAPSGWEETVETQVFSGVALSDYINGGAEAYHAYGFDDLAVREFRDAADARLTVEIYKMDSPENAYGIFSTDPAGKRWTVGADASYGSGLLRFWKGPYFVRIMCFPPDPSIEAVIRETGGKIADAITAESSRPELLRLLPATKIMDDTVCYFHRQTSLNNIRFLSDENLLHLNDTVEALTWEERIAGAEQNTQGEESSLRQFVLKYPSTAEARAAFEDFSRKYLDVSGAPPLTAKQTEGTFAVIDWQTIWIMIVLDAPSPEMAVEAVKSTGQALHDLDQGEVSS